MAGLAPTKEPDNLAAYNHPQPTHMSDRPRQPANGANDTFANEKSSRNMQDAPVSPDAMTKTEKQVYCDSDHAPIRFMGFTGNSLIWAVTLFATGETFSPVVSCEKLS